jgi:glycosyltransferase involved in cell wall biosynthesis
MKKILSICISHPLIEGSFEEFLLALSKELRDLGWENTIAFIGKPIESLEKKLKMLGVEIKIIPLYKEDFSNTISFLSLIKETKPSLIHIHFYYPPYSLLNLYCYLKKIPLIYTEHFLPSPKGLLRNVTRNILHKIKAKIFNFGICKIICVSNFVKEEHKKHYSVSEKKLIRIYNGINLERFGKLHNPKPLRDEIGIDPNTQIITCIATMEKRKGVQYLINAAPLIIKEVPDIKFLIVGDGPYLPSLKEMVHELNLDQYFIFTGWRSDTERILSISTVLVVPSMSNSLEAFGFVAAEGMACGIPVVASKIGGLREVVEDNVTGFLIEPDNSEVLAEKVICVLKDNGLRIDIKKSYERAKLFSLERMIKEYMSLYKTCLCS